MEICRTENSNSTVYVVAVAMTSYESFINSAGAEERSIWALFMLDPVLFSVFFVALTVSPHCALLCLYITKGNVLVDRILFGQDEYLQKGLWNWLFFLVSPGLNTCYYLLYFLDTNPTLILILLLTFIGSDVKWMTNLLMLSLEKLRAKSISFICGRWLSCVLVSSIAYLVLKGVYFILYLFVPSYSLTILGTLFTVTMTVYCMHQMIYVLNEIETLLSAVKRARKYAVLIHDTSVINSIYESCIKEPEIYCCKNDMSEWCHDMKIELDEETLGAGSFGEVKIGKLKEGKVAIKSIRKNIALPGPAQRHLASMIAVPDAMNSFINQRFFQGRPPTSDQLFYHEAKILQAISSSEFKCNNNIVKLANISKPFAQAPGGTFYIAFRHYNPVTLEKYIKEHPHCDLRTKLRIIQKLFAAVSHIHAAGIVHRDIKPDNVLLEIDSSRNIVEPILIDFGLASLANYDNDHFINNGMGGEFYKPPEFFLFKYSKVNKDLKALCSQGVTFDGDVWACAILAMFVLTGSQFIYNLDLILLILNFDNWANESNPLKLDTAVCIYANLSRWPECVSFVQSFFKDLRDDPKYRLKYDQQQFEMKIKEKVKEKYNSIDLSVLHRPLFSGWADYGVSKTLNQVKQHIPNDIRILLRPLNRNFFHDEITIDRDFIEDKFRKWLKLSIGNDNISVIELLLAMVNANPDYRRSMKEAADHPCWEAQGIRPNLSLKERSAEITTIFKNNKNLEDLRRVLITHMSSNRFGIDKPTFVNLQVNKFLSKKQLENVFDYFDADKSEKLDRREVLAGLYNLRIGLSTSEDKSKYEYVFHAYDINGDGNLSRDEFAALLESQIMKEWGFNNSSEEFENKFNEFDTDKNKLISLQEFVKAMEDIASKKPIVDSRKDRKTRDVTAAIFKKNK